MTYSQKKFVTAIKGSGGIVSAIARKVGCTWYTAKKYIDENPDVARAYADEIESNLDIGETVIINNMKRGDSGDSKWYLTKKGKHRGYDQVETVHLEQTFRPDLSKLSEEDLLTLKKIVKGIYGNDA